MNGTQLGLAWAFTMIVCVVLLRCSAAERGLAMTKKGSRPDVEPVPMRNVELVGGIMDGDRYSIVKETKVFTQLVAGVWWVYESHYPPRYNARGDELFTFIRRMDYKKD
jgi:hypothetical protein